MMKYTKELKAAIDVFFILGMIGSVLSAILLVEYSDGISLIVGIVALLSLWISRTFVRTICEISENLFFIRKSVSDSSTDENDDTDSDIDIPYEIRIIKE